MFFVTSIGAHLIFGAKTAVTVAGVACVATGILWMFRRTVAVGVEGRAPSFYLGGWAAVVVGVAIAIVGVCLLAYSGLAACLLGWAPAGECWRVLIAKHPKTKGCERDSCANSMNSSKPNIYVFTLSFVNLRMLPRTIRKALRFSAERPP